MKRLKLFPKVFLYTFGLMLFIVLIAHGLLYFLTPKAALDFMLHPNSDTYIMNATFDLSHYVTNAILKVLPISLAVCSLLAAICSALFSKELADPLLQFSATTEKMAQLDKNAVCPVHSDDEIGKLAVNINNLYQSLLTTIENLETEKRHIRENERSKVDFLRAASHELKTPITALNATLENMILGVGKYRDYDAYLPECKEMTEQLAQMIHDILETSKAGLSAESEAAVETDLAGLLSPLCEPYELIAKTHGLIFRLSLQHSCAALLPPGLFGKAVSNILANAVAYTKSGGTIFVYFSGRSIVIENECAPISAEDLRHLFEPFYRPDYARSRDEGGNGLGLYIVDTIFQTLDIPYSFEPMDQPQGMRFTISLPN